MKTITALIILIFLLWPSLSWALRHVEMSPKRKPNPSEPKKPKIVEELSELNAEYEAIKKENEELSDAMSTLEGEVSDLKTVIQIEGGWHWIRFSPACRLASPKAKEKIMPAVIFRGNGFLKVLKFKLRFFNF